jgi:hypothetical protein
MEEWRVVANACMLSKQSRQPTSVGPPACGLGEVLQISHREYWQSGA